MTVYIDPRCPPHVEKIVRERARLRGEQALPRMLRPLTEDQRVTMERKWAAPRLAAKAQKPCDHGLFSDEADQLDLCEMFQDPTNGE